eukprot:scaffold106095_cov63-Phaeocystis_antarctica.AAC.1
MHRRARPVAGCVLVFLPKGSAAATHVSYLGVNDTHLGRRHLHRDVVVVGATSGLGSLRGGLLEGVAGQADLAIVEVGVELSLLALDRAVRVLDKLDTEGEA